MSRNEINEFTTATYGIGLDEMDVDTQNVMWSLVVEHGKATPEFTFHRSTVDGLVGIAR